MSDQSLVTRAKAFAEAMLRTDGWVNLVTGVGNSARSSFDFMPVGMLDPQLLDDLFHEDDVVYRMCAVPPQEWLREGWDLQMASTAGERIVNRGLERLGIQRKLEEAATWARLWGGALIVLGIDDGRAPEEPVDENSVRSVTFAHVVDKRWVYPDLANDFLMKGLYGRPDRYRIQRPGLPGAVVHHTRTLRFDGTMTSILRRARYQGWSESVVLRAWAALSKFSGSFEGASALVQDSSQGVLKIGKLWELMKADSKDRFKKRLEFMDMARSTTRTLLLDTDEQYERVESSALSGVADVLDRMSQRMAAAVEMPVTILMGESPAGLNATGAADIRWWYDRLASSRKRDLDPQLLYLARMLALAAGAGPADLPTGVTWPPFWQSTEEERANAHSTQASADEVYLRNGVLTAAEVRKSRFGSGRYATDTQLDPQNPPAGGAEQDGGQAQQLAALAGMAYRGELPVEAARLLAGESFPSAAPEVLDRAFAIIARERGAAPPPVPLKGDRADTAGTLALVLVRPVGSPPVEVDAAYTTRLHLTLAILSGSELSPSAERELRAWAKATPPLVGTIAGGGRFLGAAGGLDAVYVHPDVPDLTAARERLATALDVAGQAPISVHGFTPHITTGYVTKDEPGPAMPSRPLPLRLDTVEVWRGDEVLLSLPLGDAPSE